MRLPMGLMSLTVCLVGSAAVALAADDARQIELGRGNLRLKAPEAWNREQPRNNIVEYEFSVAPAEGAADPAPGRVTIMGAGGGVEQNIQRWKDQFRSPSGDDVEAKVEKLAIGDNEVYLVDIQGTYLDKPGPFVPGPGTPREGYRMYSAIIRTKDSGDYFIRLNGPSDTVAANVAGLRKMVEELETVK